ncbi:PKD domain-containing protein [bacterium]|nr:PKD domain-containing protein [bacterium]
MQYLIYTRALRVYYVIACACLLLLATNCGSGGSATTGRLTPDPQVFALNVSPQSLFDGASAEDFALSVTESANGAEATVRVTGAVGLKALYLELEFDPTRYTPAGVTASEVLGARTELLVLEVLRDRGHVHYGQVLIHPQDQVGFTGDGVLATFRFRAEPQDATRSVSAPPASAASQTLLTKTGSLLQWYYYNVGDYNQDGLVSVHDLTPLGVHFEEQSAGFPAPFPIGTVQSAIDGNGDGYITIHDITPIGANFDNSVLGGYHIYESATLDDYPADPADFGSVPTIAELDTIAFNLCQGTASADRLCFEANITTSLVDGYYWVRPTDGTNDGTPSNLAGGGTTAAVQFDVASTPTLGAGSQADPYAVDGGSVIDFELIDPNTASPIPATDTDAELILDNPAAGSLSGFQFSGNAAYSGQFAVYALYQDKPTNPQKICFYVAQGAGVNNAPNAIAHAAPTAGGAPLNVVFDGGFSYDIDSGDAIASYEWDFGEGGGFQLLTDVATHLYTTPGAYTARLRVTDTVGATDTESLAITVGTADTSGPTALLTAIPASGSKPLAVAFDASASSAGASPIASYEYDVMGNGAFVLGGSSYNYTYNQAGTYRVTLKVTDSAGRLDSAVADVIVTESGTAPVPPTAALAVTPDKGQAPLTVTFDLTGSTTGTGVTYDLDPGDSSSTYDPSGYPTQGHTYGVAGTYLATVVATDSASGLSSVPAYVAVTVQATGALTAILGATPATGAAPLAVTLDATGTSGGTAPYTYDFDFTDDGTWDVTGNTLGTADHTYATAGTYTARVRVTDGASATDEDTVTVNVTSGSTPLVADLTANPTGGLVPLTVSLDATGTTGGVSPYTFDFDFTDDGTYDVNGNTTGTTSTIYSTAGTYTVRVRVTDSAAPTPATDEDTVTINVSAGGSLTASLVATPPAGGIPLAVTLDATGSTGGTPPYTYDFDFTDNGSYDVVGNSTGTTPNSYGVVGDYTARVRVTDSSTPTPLTDTATALIEATAPLTPALSATPPDGLDPLTTTLDATASSGGKAPLTFDFDYTDDGVYDVNGNTTGSVSGVTYTPAGPYTARVRVTDSCAVPQSVETTASVYSAELLVANLTATPATGFAPPADTVLLDASGSTGGVPPLQYRFDFESDGTWDTTWSTTPTVTPTAPYYWPGYHTPTVDVQDSGSTPQNQQASTMFTVARNAAATPPSGWHVVTVVPGITANWISYTSLTLVQGIPVISYYDDDTVTPGKQGLYFVAANDNQGNTWQAPVQIMPGAVGVHSSIKEVVGEPAIAFFNQTAVDLEYIRRNVTWPAGAMILDTPACGSWCSMDFIFDDSIQLWLPAVSYIGEIGLWEFEWQYHGADVRYIPSVYPPDNLGTAWHTPQIIESSLPTGYPQFACTSLEYVDYGNNYPSPPPPYTWSPAVSYIALDYVFPNGLKYSIANDRLGWTWSRAGFPLWVVQTNAATVGTMTSLEKFPGSPWNPNLMGAPAVTPGIGWRPWISWCNASLPSPLALEEGLDDPGTSWLFPNHSPDPILPTCGDFSSLEMVGPVLGMSHTDYGNGELCYIDMAATSPLLWNATETPDRQPVPGADHKWGSYLIENQGYPAISYYYSTGAADELRYAVFY